MSGVIWTPQKRGEQAERMAALVWTPDRLATLRALAGERLPGTVIAAASVRAATEAGLRPDVTDVSFNLAGPAFKRQAGSFGVASVAACTARPALSVSHMDNAQGPSCVPVLQLPTSGGASCP